MKYFSNKLNDYIGHPSKMDLKILKESTNSIVHRVIDNFKIIDKNVDGGLYVGLAGVSYMLYHISKNPIFENERMTLLEDALKFIKLPLSHAMSGDADVIDRVSFLTGDLGSLAVAAVVSHKLGRDSHMFVNKYKEAFKILKEINWFKNGGDELFVGRCGYLCGLLWMQKEMNLEIQNPAELWCLLDTVVNSGRTYSQKVHSSFPLMYHYYNTQYLGQAHGLSGILTVLLSFPEWLEANKSTTNIVKQTVDALLQLQTSSGNFPCATDEINPPRASEKELVHWCHGAPGTIYMLAKAFLVFKDDKYLAAALKCGELTWEKGLLLKGPGICHGVSGSGYVFLILFQLTKEPKHLFRAFQFMSFMETSQFRHARIPDCPFSLFEGLAGKACFISDIMHPLGSFPFFSIC